VKLAESGGLLLEPRVTGKRVFGRVKREPIVTGGMSGNGVKAWASAKPGAIRQRQCVTASGWITAREHGGPERGARFLRGEYSEGRSQERLRHETGPRKSGLLGNR
jgi:hypothetical protein